METKSTRDVILDVAERQFAERGFRGVSVREIAAEVGLKNQASLYHYFRNKRALYEAVLARGVSTLVELVASGAPTEERTQDHRAVVEATIDRVVDYLVLHPHLPRLIQRAGMDDVQAFRGTLVRLLRPLFQQGIGVLAVAGAPWRREELPHLAAGIYHLIFGYFANSPLLSVVTESNWLDAASLARQRRFLKAAVSELLGFRRSGEVRLLGTVASGQTAVK
ncbi:MAG: TetR/AcrR family transcriptional regulator [Candidatus Binatia bacterium]|nr:TetR/AcrR family transcriptional regulator [Candidatus Binatia bacterium]